MIVDNSKDGVDGVLKVSTGFAFVVEEEEEEVEEDGDGEERRVGWDVDEEGRVSDCWMRYSCLCFSFSFFFFSSSFFFSSFFLNTKRGWNGVIPSFPSKNEAIRTKTFRKKLTW